MQRVLVSVGLLASVIAATAGSARAESPRGGSWFELGLGWTRFAPHDASPEITGGAASIAARSVRFGFGASVSRHVFFSGEADFGRIDDGTRGDDFAGGRSAVSTPEPEPRSGALQGQFGAARIVLGTRARAGMLTGAAELAAGVRGATYTADSFAGNADQVDLVLEGRGRLEAWVTPVVTIGATAGVDLRDHEGVTLGLSIGLHFSAYDGIR